MQGGEKKQKLLAKIPERKLLRKKKRAAYRSTLVDRAASQFTLERANRSFTNHDSQHTTRIWWVVEAASWVVGHVLWVVGHVLWVLQLHTTQPPSTAKQATGGLNVTHQAASTKTHNTRRLPADPPPPTASELGCGRLLKTRRFFFKTTASGCEAYRLKFCKKTRKNT